MPLLAVGLGAVAAGAAMQVAGNRKDQSAINAARSKELGQQKELQAQASDVFQTSADANSAPVANATLDQGAAARAAIANALKTSTSSTALPSNQDSYQVTGGSPMSGAVARTATAGNAWSNVVGGAANRLGSYSDLAGTQGVANQQANAKLGVISSKARGDANLLPLEIQVASHKGDGLSGWGQIVSALGSVASMGAAAGFGAGGAGVGTASAAQMDALASGFGPVTAGSAATLAPSTFGAWGASQFAAPFWSQALAVQP